MERKYKTRDGRDVRLLCTDGPGEYPVIGTVKGCIGPHSWSNTGRNDLLRDETPKDLIEVPPVYLEPWKWYKQGDNAYCTAPNKDSRYIDIYSCQYGSVHLHNHRISELTPLSKILPGAVEISQPKETK
jgi:hypothetical protein